MVSNRLMAVASVTPAVIGTSMLVRPRASTAKAERAKGRMA